MDHPLFTNLTGDLPTEEQEEISTQIRADKAKLPYINLKNYPINFDVLKLLPLEEAESHRLTPFALSGRILKVAATMPPVGPAKTCLIRLEQQSGYEIEINITSPGSLNSLLARYAKLIQEGKIPQKAELKTEPEKSAPLKDIHTLADVAKSCQSANTSQMLDIILAGALNNEASDIHIEPQATDFVVRYRLDGVLYDVVRLPQINLHSLISRIKILAHLRLDLDSAPQDGSFHYQLDSTAADFRVSLLPTQYGETAVLRIIKSNRAFLPLPNLGFSAHDQDRIKSAAAATQGIIIASGPTGAGKTTTLYALLNLIKSPTKKIITLENPIEYRIEGVQQSQINHEEHYDFASGLREVLRQDPNVIMVGEIRDRETADVAFDAAITGHLVLTTMHSPSAIKTFARLLDLGVKQNLLSGSIRLVINQRLVRRLCLECHGKGCQKCNNLGFKGRIVLAETLTPTAEFEKALFAGQDAASLIALGQKDGLKTIAEDGQAKITAGITTAEEVARVA